jgi:hypothetical protein
MKLFILSILVTLALIPTHAGLGAEGNDAEPKPAKPQTSSKFTHVDLYLDPKGAPLAAWQLEFTAEMGNVSLVGIETGDHSAYSSKPPYYDPAALAGNRILLADFTLDPNPPKEKTRIARLMLEVKGDAVPQYATKLITAANSEGNRITADLTLMEPKPQSRSDERQ